MKKSLLALMLMPMMALAEYYETVDGIKWCYYITSSNTAVIYGTSIVEHHDSYTSIQYVPAIDRYTAGSVTIPSKLGGCPVGSISSRAFYGCDRITSITIPSSVTVIDEYAFSGCSGLTSVNIPPGVTRIKSYAFENCCRLTSVNIPSGVTSIEWGTFYNCIGLASVTIPLSVTNVNSSAFSLCRGITSVTVPGWKCRIDFSNVTNLVICEGVTNIEDSAFSQCPKLTSVSIPSSVVSIGSEAFLGCHGLSSLAIPSSVRSIGDRAFYYCEGLSSLVIPPTVGSVGECAFGDCQGLMSVEICEGVTNIGCQAFSGCSRLASVVIPSSVSNIEDAVFSRCSGLESMTIPSSVKRIGNSAFSGCSGLASVTVPSSVTSIGDWAFESCNGLKSITIPSSVTEIGRNPFRGCTLLASVFFDGDAPITKGSLFDPLAFAYTFYVKRNSSGWNVAIPGIWQDVPISYVEDGRWTELVNGVTWTYAIVDGNVALAEMHTTAEDVTIPSSIGGLTVTELKDGLFRGNTSMKSVEIPSSVTKIGNSAFERCTKLQRVTLPNGLKTIGDSAFERCVHLTGMTIPASVASIGCFAFKDCLSLQNIDLKCPESVAEVGAFAGTPNHLSTSSGMCDAVNITVTNVVVQYVINCASPEIINPTNVTDLVGRGCSVDSSLKVVYLGETADKDMVKKMLKAAGVDLDHVSLEHTNEYMVWFDLNGVNGVTLPILLETDKVYGLPKFDSLRIAPPTGMHFAGWRDSSGKRYDDGILFFNLAKSGTKLSLTAIWEKD